MFWCAWSEYCSAGYIITRFTVANSAQPCFTECSTNVRVNTAQATREALHVQYAFSYFHVASLRLCKYNECGQVLKQKETFDISIAQVDRQMQQKTVLCCIGSLLNTANWDGKRPWKLYLMIYFTRAMRFTWFSRRIKNNQPTGRNWMMWFVPYNTINNFFLTVEHSCMKDDVQDDIPTHSFVICRRKCLPYDKLKSIYAW